MKFSLSKAYIESNPVFVLTTTSLPNISKGQRIIIFNILIDAYPTGLSLEQLVKACYLLKYREKFKNKNTDIRKSILYHLNRIDSVKQQ